ncbi:MAG: alpha/beta fold hydrolase [Actinomycetota bacterium]
MIDSKQPPVLLVHGWAGSFDRTWKRAGLVDLLADSGRTVLPYDLPGHGTASKSHEPYDYRDLAGDLLRRAEASGEVVDAVGFSLGAITLLRAVLRSPTLFRRVVLAGIGDGVFFPHDPSRSERILSGLEGRADPGDLTARIFGKIGNEAHNDPLALAAVLRRPREDPMSAEQLALVTNDVLVVLGDKDFSAPADRLVSAIPHARFVSLKGIDHFRTPEAFEFIDAVLEFLSA